MYLGVILDSEMSLNPLYRNIKRRIEQKLCKVRRIRYVITKDAAL